MGTWNLPDLIFRLSSYGMVVWVVIVGHSTHFTGKCLQITQQSRSLFTIKKEGMQRIAAMGTKVMDFVM